MNIGTQLEASEGWGPLVKGRTYYLLASQAEMRRVLLVWYIPPQKQTRGRLAGWCARILAMPRDDFEEGLTQAHIVPREVQHSLPPWLSHLEGLDLDKLDKTLQDRKYPSGEREIKWVSYRKRPNEKLIERRYAKLETSMLEIDILLRAPRPEQAVNRQARKVGANETRFRLWCVTYRLFGNNRWALLPAYYTSGRWDRTEAKYKKNCFGRPSLSKGRYTTRRLSKDNRDLVVKSYRKICDLGKTQDEIYTESMKKYWGVLTTTGSEGKREFYHPDGKQYPTLSQYWYEVRKQVGERQMDLDRYGEARVRHRSKVSRGSFAAQTGNLLERTEGDGYWTAQYPRGLNGEVLESLVVVRLVDTATSARFGVGIHFGSETAQAYRSALFSAAIGLRRYVQLFGLDLEELDAPHAGIPAKFIVDRGPGSSDKVRGIIPIRELAQGYSGQSKGQVEASNPRQHIVEGAPSHLVSRMTPIEMARQEIWRAIRDNHVRDASGRSTPKSTANTPGSTPMDQWRYLKTRGRTSGIQVTFADAVRRYLLPAAANVKRSGIEFNRVLYTSPALYESGFLERADGDPVDIYVLPMCVRHVWLEANGQILELDMTLPIKDDPEQLFMSLPELTAHADRVAVKRSVSRESDLAAQAYCDDLFERQTGQRFDDRQRRSGRAKPRSKASRQAAKEMKPHLHGGRR